MPVTKKILFLNYADNSPDDVKMFHNLSLHLSILKDKVEAWSKAKIMAGEVKEEIINANIKNADAVIHLLSVHFENENQCLKLLETSILEKKKIIPILISSFDWESDESLAHLKNEMLPEDKKPIDSYNNPNEVFTEIVKSIRVEVFGDSIPEPPKSDRNFYYILATIVFLIGCSATWWVYTTFHKISISVMVFLMFCCIILLVVRKVLFPTNISSIK
jgi:hypothetical protein